MRKSCVSLALAAILVLWLVVAGADSGEARAGLDDFVLEHEAHLKIPGPLLSTPFDDLLIQVEEAAGDGERYSFLTTVALRPGVAGVVRPFNERNFEQGDFSKSPDGGPVYYVHQDVSGALTGNMRENSDGSMSFVSDSGFTTVADAQEIVCHVTYVKAASGQIPRMEDVRQKAFSFSVQTLEALDARRLESGPVTIGETNITVDGLFIKQVPGFAYCAMYFTYPGGEPVGYGLPRDSGYGCGVDIRLLDAQGQKLGDYTSFMWQGETRYIGFIHLRPADRPLTDGMTIEAVDVATGNILGREPVRLEKGGFSPEGIEDYMAENGGTEIRGGTQSWEESERGLFYAMLVPQEGETVPVYLDPDDPDSLIAEYYGGISMPSVSVYKDWRNVYFGNAFFPEAASTGYVRKEDVVLWDGVTLPEETPYGVSAVQVMPASGDAAVARLGPSEDTTVAFQLERGETVYVLSRVGGWRQIITAYEGGGWCYGYVRAEDLLDTGTRTYVLLSI